MTTRSRFAMLVILSATGLAPARAQIMSPGPGPNLEGVTVAGKGSAGAKPNRLEIDLEVSASSELTADAIVKYRDAKKRLHDAFATLKLADVAVEERVLSINQKGQQYNPYSGEMPTARKGKVEVQLTRKLVVTHSKIREMDEDAVLQLVAKLLDVAQDAGAKVGSAGEFNPYSYRMGGSNTPLVRFILDDFDAPQEKAYASAIADARARAGRLAKLSGAELGPVVGVREVNVPGEKTPGLERMYYYGLPAEEEEMPRKRLETTRFQEIPVKVELQVRFDVAGAVKAAAREGAK